MEKQSIQSVGCTKCGSVESQVKQGKTAAGSQRIRCNKCGNRYTPVQKRHDEATRLLAVKAYMSGSSARKVGKLFGIDGNTVTAWVIFFRGESAIRQSMRK